MLIKWAVDVASLELGTFLRGLIANDRSEASYIIRKYEDLLKESFRYYDFYFFIEIQPTKRHGESISNNVIK